MQRKENFVYLLRFVYFPGKNLQCSNDKQSLPKLTPPHTQANGTVNKDHSEVQVLLPLGELVCLGHHEPPHCSWCSLFLRIRVSRSASSCPPGLCWAAACCYTMECQLGEADISPFLPFRLVFIRQQTLKLYKVPRYEFQLILFVYLKVDLRKIIAVTENVHGPECPGVKEDGHLNISPQTKIYFFI